MQDSPVCGWTETQDGTKCLCTNIEPFIVQADPQEPDYWDPGPIPPLLLDIFFPDPGDSPSGHDPQDPCEWNCPMIFDVTIWCETNVRRGEDGRCELEVEPDELLDHVYGWEFRGKGPGYEGLLAYSQQYHETHWEGPIVASGEVRVDFRVKDEFDHTFDLAAKTEIAVVPREWSWADEGGVTMQNGTGIMSWPTGHEGIGIVCRPGQPCPLGEEGHIVQPDTLFSSGNGFTADEVPQGPNTGIWYVSGVTVDLHMVGMVNPDYLPEGAWPAPVVPEKYLATGPDAVACGLGSGDTVSVSFVEYNENCRFHSGYLVSFETWAWNHEATHMANAVTYAEDWASPQFDPAAMLEGVVRNSVGQVNTEANDRLLHIPRCVRRAAATHGHLGALLSTFPGIPDDTWFWSGSGFQEAPSGWVWWTAGPDPFSSPCLP